MPFEPGQTVIHEAEVAGFSTKSVAVITSVAEGKVSVGTASGGRPLPGTFGLDDGKRLDAAKGSPRERICEVPAPASDLWGPRSGWIPADAPPHRDGWYEFKRAVDGSVDLCYFVAGTWLTGDELAPVSLAGGESWQGLGADPVELYLDAKPVAAEPRIRVAQPEGKDDEEPEAS
jgi:hypothetical protein